MGRDAVAPVMRVTAEDAIRAGARLKVQGTSLMAAPGYDFNAAGWGNHPERRAVLPS
jgi:hypothetical protein